MGLPALINEGLSWREVRLRAMHAAPVILAPLPATAVPERAAAAGAKP
jgi:phosphatidylinositol alpha-mannosyltransferase